MPRSLDFQSCASVRSVLEAWVDQELEPRVAARIRAHVETCTACAAEARLAERVRDDLRALPELETPAAVVEAIFARTSRAAARPRRPALLSAAVPRPVWAALAAAILLLGLGLAVLWRPTPEPSPYDAAAVERATAEARFALMKTGLLTRRAGEVVRQRALEDRIVRPTERGLRESLGAAVPASPPRLDDAASVEGVEDV